MSVSIAGAIGQCQICDNYSIIREEKKNFWGKVRSKDEKCLICSHKIELREKKLKELGI